LSRQTRAIIHPQALQHNFARLQPSLPSRAIAVIKADAYGHGAVTVATALSDLCTCFAVAICDEVRPLRDAGITQPVVVLEGPHDMQDCLMAKASNSILVVHNTVQLDWLTTLPASQRPEVWLKVDSGMHRLGFSVDDAIALLASHEWLTEQPCVLVTHFACADEPDNPFNTAQFDAFNRIAAATNLPVCVANSAATLTHPDQWGAWCRLGIGVYGASPLANKTAAQLELQAAMTLQAEVIGLHNVKKGESVGYSQSWKAPRDSVIATVGIGYADGYPRHCPTGTPVVIRGHRAPLVGRVSMDMITIDVTDIPDVALQDTVELWGRQLPVDEVAQCAGTISYELTTRVSTRVPRTVEQAARDNP
jgi:alanine racemase